jgi:hypothetical protein
VICSHLYAYVAVKKTSCFFFFFFFFLVNVFGGVGCFSVMFWEFGVSLIIYVFMITILFFFFYFFLSRTLTFY